MARLMAMIPSLFAILAAFLVMRGASISLNIATILIGSTVLGATENDQVHFFYHYQEGRGPGSTLDALRHAFLVAGEADPVRDPDQCRGFLALSFSKLPPMRQFGTVSASAFMLALLADFTALPAALWICTRSPKDLEEEFMMTTLPSCAGMTSWPSPARAIRHRRGGWRSRRRSGASCWIRRPSTSRAEKGTERPNSSPMCDLFEPGPVCLCVLRYAAVRQRREVPERHRLAFLHPGRRAGRHRLPRGQRSAACASR